MQAQSVKDSIESEALRAEVWDKVKTKGFIKPLALGGCEVWVDRWIEGEGKGGVWFVESLTLLSQRLNARGGEGEGKGGVKGLSSRAEMRVRVRGEYGFSSLVKQKKKDKICFVIYIAGFFF